MSDALNRARLIGIIILTRFLKLPLTKYELMIEKVEDSPMFRQLWPDIISTNPFPSAQALESARHLTANAIGQLREAQLGFSVSYRHARLAGDYAIDEAKMRRWRQTQALSMEDEAELLALKRQLRLINTRNRLTHMVLMGIAEHQGAYLASGDALRLRSLSQVTLAQWIKSEARGDSRFLPPGSRLEVVDNSMISKLSRNISVLSPQGQDIPLGDLFPSTRDVHKRLIEAILEEEKEQIGRGDMERAYTDGEIKERLEERYGVSVSRRTVSACRRGMMIPSSYTRNSNRTYPPRLARFSFHYPMNIASVEANAPEASGLYEISLAEMEVDYPLSRSAVVYVGSARNLRRRLRDHLRPGSKNGGLQVLLRDHRALFRYVVKHRGIRAEEKMLCECFMLAYGALPRCNRIRP